MAEHLDGDFSGLNQQEETTSNKSAYTTRSQTTELAPSSSTGVLPKICIFLHQKGQKA